MSVGWSAAGMCSDWFQLCWHWQGTKLFACSYTARENMIHLLSRSQLHVEVMFVELRRHKEQKPSAENDLVVQYFSDSNQRHISQKQRLRGGKKIQIPWPCLQPLVVFEVCSSEANVTHLGVYAAVGLQSFWNNESLYTVPPQRPTRQGWASIQFNLHTSKKN